MFQVSLLDRGGVHSSEMDQNILAPSSSSPLTRSSPPVSFLIRLRVPRSQRGEGVYIEMQDPRVHEAS